MKVKATFRHVFEVTREVEIDDEDFARLREHQAIRDLDTSDEYLIPIYIESQDTEFTAEVFSDWKTSAPLPSDFELQWTEVTDAERLDEPTMTDHTDGGQR
jgi:hypothetical protein